MAKNETNDLSSLIQAMLRPQTYPHPVAKVELAQTQMSLVFLTGQYAYKVKKPVNLGYLDYTTLDKRHHFCLREVELNRRLCPDAYLEVVPLVFKSGGVALGGEGKIVEYAVKMRQLPQDRMMDKLLIEGRVSMDMVRAVAERLAEFHRLAETNNHINTFGELCSIMVNTDENFTQAEEYIGRSISEEQHDKIKSFTDAFIRSNAALMHDRIDQGRIRDCHGDLHAAHVCFTDDICIYDCIEFNDRFRYSDVASEVAFLAMDLDRYGYLALSRCFVASYVQYSGDQGLMAVLNFYKCYRAYVRGKVESFKLNDPHIPKTEKTTALDAAKEYFGLADLYTSKS